MVRAIVNIKNMNWGTEQWEKEDFWKDGMSVKQDSRNSYKGGKNENEKFDKYLEWQTHTLYSEVVFFRGVTADLRVTDPVR